MTNETENAQQQPEGFVPRLKYSIKNTRTRRWLRFGIVAAIYLAWVIWLGNYWFLLGLPLLFDIYISGFIPFTWWKKSKNAAVRTVMSWVDAIVYALILVYFIFLFVGQNYQIPSSSLERTLLVGDYLWVNKMIYGPRVPNTPIHFPLVHNTLPILNCDSYTDWPENSYRRLKGLRNVELGDIVVFNFPAGDTVASKMEENPEYYYILVKKYGWDRVNSDKETFGEIKYRPVDRRTNFVKRAVGLPGQRLAIRNDIIYLDGKAQKTPENAQFRYIVATKSPLLDDMMRDFGISPDDVAAPEPEDAAGLAQFFGFPGNSYIYSLPLTRKALDNLKNSNITVGIIKANDRELYKPEYIFPEGIADAEEWTLSNYGGKDGILIPKKGMTVPLTERNWLLYNRIIRNYENHPDARFANGKVYIDGKPADKYTFAMDYYWMMGDNRDMSQDSRFWGFVPEDHIVGTPMFVLASFDKDRPLTDGYFRWNRFFTSANPDKK